MAEQKNKVEVTWLQCQLPRNEWNQLNERRLKLNLKWADIIVPATKDYFSKLEASPSTQQPKPEKPTKRAPATTKSKNAIKKTTAEVKAEDSKLKDNSPQIKVDTSQGRK